MSTTSAGEAGISRETALNAALNAAVEKVNDEGNVLYNSRQFFKGKQSALFLILENESFLFKIQSNNEWPIFEVN